MRDQTQKVQADELIARILVANPKKYLKQFREYWGKNLPDLSEGRVPKPERLQFWRNMKCCAGLHAHGDLPGLCRKWVHIAFDFAISQNQWPIVCYREELCEQEEGGEVEKLVPYDMVVPFTLTAWACYCAQMNGSPAFTSKACQKVHLCFGNPISVLKTVFVFSNTHK